MNAFNEEFTLKAAPLSVLEPAVGRGQALCLTTYYFGVGHYYGVPYGIVGVLLAGFLGWFLGKSMQETGASRGPGSSTSFKTPSFSPFCLCRPA